MPVHTAIQISQLLQVEPHQDSEFVAEGDKHVGRWVVSDSEEGGEGGVGGWGVEWVDGGGEGGRDTGEDGGEGGADNKIHGVLIKWLKILIILFGNFYLCVGD